MHCIVLFLKKKSKNQKLSKKLYCIVFEFCIIFKNKKLKSCFVLYYIQKIKFLGFLHIELKLKYCIVLFSKQTKNEKNNMGFWKDCVHCIVLYNIKKIKFLGFILIELKLIVLCCCIVLQKNNVYLKKKSFFFFCCIVLY